MRRLRNLFETALRVLAFSGGLILITLGNLGLVIPYIIAAICGAEVEVID